MSAIAVEALAKTLQGGVVAGDEISFQGRAGEIFGLLGPNRAGKTTTLHMLATLLRPAAGTPSVAGHELWTEAPAIRRDIGVALQEAGSRRRADRTRHQPPPPSLAITRRRATT